ncbi:Bacteroidetes-Associated Carbohydrate-binding Often N-terminal [Alistipes finegoldii]|nr:Bacteroidetes-Associated Carbohydrate-binding Often N-terminal [Alistipes finegoldii]
MSKHLFRLLFGAFFLVAATAFTGCSDDDDKSLTPKLTADPTALDFTDETATTQTVAITANCEWTVTASNLDWATISPMSGKGNGTISVTVSELPAGTNLREGKISFTLIHPEFGKWGQAESSVAVKQYGSGVTPPPTGDAVVITIPEIIAKLTTSQVALDTNNDRYFEAVVVTDKEGGNFNGQNLQVMTPGATTAKNGITLYGSGKYTDPYDDGFTFVKGDKVKVTLKKGEARIVSYNGLYEVTGSKGADWVEIEKIGTETITPVVVDPAKLAEYQGMVVTVKGVTAPATAADWTTNEAFGKHTFTTSAGNMTVFVQKAMPGLVGTQFVAGSTGDITGYASVNSNAAQVCPQRPEDVAAFMGEPSTDPAITKLDPTSLSFAATDNAKTVTVTAANADDCTIEAATDKSEQFTTSVNGMVVTVTPKENTTEQAITATLTIKLMKAGAAVDTKTVAISQAGKSVPGGSGYTRVNAVTAGKKYLIVAETGEKNYVFEAAQLAGGARRPNGVEIAVSNSKIESNTTNDAYAVTIEASGDGYVIKTAGGKFVEYNGSSTTLKLSDTAGRIWIATAVQAKNTIKFTDKETMSASTVRCLLFQNTSAYQRFGGYAEQNADTSDYVTVALYELSE